MEFTDSHRRSMFGVSRPQAYQFAEIIAEYSVAKATSDQAAAVARGKAEETRRKTLLSLAVIANAMSWDRACDYWVHDLQFGDQLSARQARRYFKEIEAVWEECTAMTVHHEYEAVRPDMLIVKEKGPRKERKDKGTSHKKLRTENTPPASSAAASAGILGRTLPTAAELLALHSAPPTYEVLDNELSNDTHRMLTEARSGTPRTTL